MENRSWACGFVPACFRACLECQRRSCATNACRSRDLQTGAAPSHARVDLAVALASDEPTTETAPWSLSLLSHVTGALAGGAAVSDVARDIGWSDRTLQRQCTAVYGYGPATLRRILRFRRAVRLLGDGLPTQRWQLVPGMPTNPTCTARSANLPACRWRRCVRIPAARTDPPNCRPGRRPSHSACPHGASYGANGPAWPAAVTFSNNASTVAGDPTPNASARRLAGDEAAPSPGACLRSSLRCRTTACCRRAARPRRATPPTAGRAARAGGRSPGIVARRERRSGRRSMSGEYP